MTCHHVASEPQARESLSFGFRAFLTGRVSEAWPVSAKSAEIHSVGSEWLDRGWGWSSGTRQDSAGALAFPGNRPATGRYHTQPARRGLRRRSRQVGGDRGTRGVVRLGLLSACYAGRSCGVLSRLGSQAFRDLGVKCGNPGRDGPSGALSRVVLRCRSGWGGIRTPGGLTPTAVFKT